MVEFTEKRHPKSKTVKSLMDDTFTARRKWIIDKQPKIVEVLSKFLLLNLEQWVSLNNDLRDTSICRCTCTRILMSLHVCVYRVRLNENISVQVHFVTHIETQLFSFVILNIVKMRVQGGNE